MLKIPYLYFNYAGRRNFPSPNFFQTFLFCLETNEAIQSKFYENLSDNVYTKNFLKSFASASTSEVMSQKLAFSQNWKLWMYHSLLVSLESIFFTDLKKSIINLTIIIILNKAVFLLRNDIINFVNSKVTHVCETVTCFTNYDVIHFYMASRHIY